MSQSQTNLYGLLDQSLPQALDALKDQGVGPLLRAVLRVRATRSAKIRDQIVAELAVKLHADKEFESLCPDCVSLMNSEGFELPKPFKFDPEKLAALIELILKYLPAILALFA